MIQQSKIAVVILAAGKGTRMKSSLPKVLFPICGRPMIDYVLDTAVAVEPKAIVVVVGHKGEQVSDSIISGWAKANDMIENVRFAWQKQMKGTGHAVMCAQSHLSSDCDNVLILCGDTPLITGDMLQKLTLNHISSNADLSLVTSLVDEPGDYGRIRRDKTGNIKGIVEANDLLPPDMNIREINAGIYIAKKRTLDALLSKLDDKNAKQEFYLTDIVRKGVEAGCTVSTLLWKNATTIQGVNDRYALTFAESYLRQTILRGLCLSGVTVRDIENTYIDYGVQVGFDTIINPGTLLTGQTNVGSGCIIGPNSHIVSSVIGDRCEIQFSVVENSKIGNNVKVGPFAHIRPDTIIDANVSVGNYAEIKNSIIGYGSKISHHSYIGDSLIGREVNVGAGTVTVNYDGTRKHKTVVEDNAFIGCNANLIAPVKIGRESYVAAGSTVTEDIPAGALGIARSRQVNKKGWVANRKQKTN